MPATESLRTRRPRTPEGRAKAARALTLWAGTTLSLVVVLSALAIWHLVRRGRFLQNGLGPARPDTQLQLPQADSQGPS